MSDPTPSKRVLQAIAAGMEDAWAVKAGKVTEAELQSFRKRLAVEGLSPVAVTAAPTYSKQVPSRYRAVWAIAASVAAVGLITRVLSPSIDHTKNLATESAEPTRGVVAIFRLAQGQAQVEAGLQQAGLTFERIPDQPGGLKVKIAAEQLAAFSAVLQGLGADGYTPEAAGDYLLITELPQPLAP